MNYIKYTMGLFLKNDYVKWKNLFSMNFYGTQTKFDTEFVNLNNYIYRRLRIFLLQDLSHDENKEYMAVDSNAFCQKISELYMYLLNDIANLSEYVKNVLELRKIRYLSRKSKKIYMKP